MFIGRTSELDTLNALYAKDSFQLVILYGRRRVGKTRLIQEFLAKKKAVYYSAIESTSEKNLEQLSESIFAATADKNLELPPFSSFEKAFDYLQKYAQKEKLIFVIDEYPYLASSERSVSSILQNAIDGQFSKTKMMMILCGSSMSFMENQVLGYQSPLYGRRTGQIRLKPFDYRTSAEFVPNYSPEDKALVYGVTGGVPKYLELVDNSLSLKENIVSMFLKPDSYLFEEPSNLLKQELREPAVYNAVIESIAHGATRLNEIASAIKKDTSTTSIYLKTLISLGIVDRMTPLLEERNTRKTCYKIQDSMFTFWYRFVLSNMYLISSGDVEYLYEQRVAPELHNYMGRIFESMCMSYLSQLSLARRAPFIITNMGSWWGTDSRTRTQTEIDIVAVNDFEKKALFCECKFRNELLDTNVYQELRKKSDCLAGFQDRCYALFSKSGFSRQLLNAAQDDERLLLVDLDSMYRAL